MTAPEAESLLAQFKTKEPEKAKPHGSGDAGMDEDGGAPELLASSRTDGGKDK